MSTTKPQSDVLVVTRDQLAAVSTPEPTDSWFPIPHHKVLETIDLALGCANFKVVAEQLLTQKGGKRFCAVLDLETPVTDTDRLMVSVMSSHDKQFATCLTCGVRSTPSGNLLFATDVSIAKRKTRNIRASYAKRVTEAVGQLTHFVEAQSDQLSRMRRQPLVDQQVESLLLRSAEQELIGWQTLPKVLNQWRTRAPCDKPDRSVYCLLQAYMEVMKERFAVRPLLAILESIKIYEFLVRSSLMGTTT